MMIRKIATCLLSTSFLFSGLYGNEEPQIINFKDKTEVYESGDQKKVYYYDEDKRIEIIEEFIGDNLYRRQRLMWLTHSQKQLLQDLIWEDEASQVVTTIHYEYNDQGVRSQEEGKSLNGSWITFYDSQGRIETTELFDKEDKFLEKSTFHYNDNGFEQIAENILGEITKFVFDASGNLVSTTLIPKEKSSLQQMVDWVWDFYQSVSTALEEWHAYITIEDEIEREVLTIVHNMFEDEPYGKLNLLLLGVKESGGAKGLFNPGKEYDPKVKITAINGILNLQESLQETIQTITDNHGGNQIYYVYRPTEGWTRDVYNCAFAKLGLVSPSAEMLANLWKELIAEIGGVGSEGTIIHYAHSLGGTDTYLASTLLTPEEKKMIEVYTIGSATMISNHAGFRKLVNIASIHDGVAYIGLFSDPISYAKALFSTEQNIHFVGTVWDYPLIDHPLYKETYNNVIISLGKKFLEKYAQKELQ